MLKSPTPHHTTPHREVAELTYTTYAKAHREVAELTYTTYAKVGTQDSKLQKESGHITSGC